MGNSNRDLAIRSLLALIPLGYAAITIWQAPLPGVAMIFVGFPCLAIGTALLYPSLSAVAGESFRGALLPQSFGDKPRPVYSRVDRMIIDGAWPAAVALLLDLGREFAFDKEICTRLFRVAWVQLKDPELANRCLLVATESTEDPAAVARIRHIYQLFADSYTCLPESDTDRPAPAAGDTTAEMGTHRLESCQTGAYCAFVRPR